MIVEVRRGQVFKHYKGGEYRVLEVGTHTENEETMIVYRALRGDPRVWVRPLGVFRSLVMVDGEAVPRFVPLV